MWNNLIGKKIVTVQKLDKESVAALGWYREDVFAIVFDDGSFMIPTSDEEGNDCGSLFVFDTDGRLENNNG